MASLEKEIKDADLAILRLTIDMGLSTRNYVDHYSNANRAANVREADETINKLVGLQGQMVLTSPRDYLYTKDAKTGKTLSSTFETSTQVARAVFDRLNKGFQSRGFVPVIYDGAKQAAGDAIEGSFELVLKALKETFKALWPIIGILAVVLVAALILQKKVR